jgi:hypothetical protein
MDVFLDRRLPDYFREHAWPHVRLRRQGEGSPFADFLNERLGVVSGCDLGALDRPFLAGLSFPQTWEFKKLQATALLGVLGGGETAAMVLRDGFHGDRGAYKHFVAQVKALRDLAHDLLAAILPCKPEVVNLVTRFSETRMENLHYDLDSGADDHEAFRLYVNLDSAPRIWATSYQMTDLFRRGGQRLVHGVDAAMPAESILKRVATRAYGGWNQRATERLAPRHLVYVDPGDVFFVDGRCVSHQVLSGHRVLSVYAKVPHGDAGVAPTFAAKIRAAFGDAQRVAPGQETAVVNYFEPAQVTAAPDVRGDWETVFGETRTGRIRRFDDHGLCAPDGARAARDAGGG